MGRPEIVGSYGLLAIAFLGAGAADGGIVGVMTVPGVEEERPVGLPRDGQYETCSLDSHPERPQPATGCSATGT